MKDKRLIYLFSIKRIIYLLNKYPKTIISFFFWVSFPILNSLLLCLTITYQPIRSFPSLQTLKINCQLVTGFSLISYFLDYNNNTYVFVPQVSIRGSKILLFESHRSYLQVRFLSISIDIIECQKFGRKLILPYVSCTVSNRPFLVDQR